MDGLHPEGHNSQVGFPVERVHDESGRESRLNFLRRIFPMEEKQRRPVLEQDRSEIWARTRIEHLPHRFVHLEKSGIRHSSRQGGVPHPPRLSRYLLLRTSKRGGPFVVVIRGRNVRSG